MKKNKLISVLALAIAATMALTACSGNDGGTGNDGGGSAAESTEGGESTDNSGQNASTSGKDTLTVAVPADSVSLDPATQNDQASSRVIAQMYDTLVTQDEDINIQPSLATSWEFVDSTHLQMNLKQGVLFHNGEELKANDVKYSIERAVESPQTASIIDMVEEVIIDDDYTVTLVLTQPFAPILAHLAHRGISIVHEATHLEKGEAYAQEPIGTGPFKFDVWVAGDRIEMSRFEDYHGNPPALNKIIMRIVTENANRAIEVETGGVDIAYDILPEDISKINDSPNASVVRDANFSTTYIGFNTQKEPFDNPLVRQAINYALNKEAIVETVYLGSGAPSNGPINSTVWGSIQDELEPYDYNMEKAKALMEEAGYADGFSTTLWTNDNAQRKDIAEIVQNQLRELNIECSVSVLEWATYLERTSAGEHDMFILGWVATTGDADRGMYAGFHSQNFGAPGNRAFYSNPEADRLLDAGRASTNDQERLEIYAELQHLLRDDAPWVFVWQGEELAGISDDITGFRIHPSGSHILYNISFK